MSTRPKTIRDKIAGHICRNHRTCKVCAENRLYATRQRVPREAAATDKPDAGKQA